ncbi:kinase-like domain-containing protein [Leptodontidium sp. MPI-SDFR-AT-0119]|nr:kinase-like domain-containing protein [Leptodontidium sp. MPI-SDFR-AT-0119]
MVPQVTNWEELALLSEEFDTETSEFRYTMFAVVDDDAVYFGQLNIPKLEISFQQLTSALSPIPDEDIFPEWPHSGVTLTQAPEVLPANIYIKRPSLALYDVFKEHNVLRLLPQGLMEEAQAMQVLSQHPHPNIIRYYGCQVRRGRITGLVLDRHPNDLTEYLKHEIGTIDREPFMEALESAIHHLHSLDWAHNDLNPRNILVNEAGMPVLIDFGSCHEIGKKLTTSRGTKGWIDEDMKDYTTSEKRHDTSALAKIRVWLDKPIFEN